MRRAPLTRTLTVLGALLALLGLTGPAAHADDATTVGLPSISLDFTAASGIFGGQGWCATGRASASAVASTWTVVFTGTRANGSAYRSGPHVFALPTMSVCAVMSKDGALTGTMTVTATYVGAGGSTPLTASGASFWTPDGDYFTGWRN